MNVDTFIQSMGSMVRSPEPLPPHLASTWGGVPGYIGQMDDVDGTKSTVTIYMGQSPDIAPIPTNSPLVGFLVGIFKDEFQNNCNKLAIYSKMEYGSDYIEVELVNITPREFSFNGTSYAPTTIGGVPGTDHKQSLDQLEQEAMLLSLQKENLDAERKRDCARNDIPCNDQYRARMAALQSRIDDLQCKALCLAGMSDSMPDCSCD